MEQDSKKKKKKLRATNQSYNEEVLEKIKNEIIIYNVSESKYMMKCEAIGVTKNYDIALIMKKMDTTLN